MYTSAQITDLLSKADQATYKCAQDNARKKVRKGVDLFKHLRLIYMVKKSLTWAKDFYLNTVGLDAVANYLYTLINPFIGQTVASIGGTIIGGGGFTQLTSAMPRRMQFKVGAIGAPMNAGDQSFIIDEKNVIGGSVSLAPSGGGELPMNDPDRLSYSVSYGTNQTVVTLSQAVQTDEEYIVRYMVGGVGFPSSGGSSGGGSSADLPDQTGKDGEVLITTGSTAFWGDLLIPVVSANFAADGVTYVNPSLAKHKFIIFWNDVPRMLIEENGDFTRLESGGFVVNIEGFNAATNSYNLFVFLMGLNDA